MAAFGVPNNLTGFAREIRLTEEDELYDLAGYDQERIIKLMSNAFSQPLTAPTKPIKISFIVGGGKLVRSKYNDDMRRWVSDALKAIGFEEDKGAALGDAGMWLCWCGGKQRAGVCVSML